MMTNVTEEGTAAGLTVGGQSFAGKTGTAEIDVPRTASTSRGSSASRRPTTRRSRSR